jgi:aspartyl-tRNA(Asn)/glutamyl-tRNA(Gln) amidotransferase subunit C
MKVDKSTVENLAKLAKLKFDETEAGQIQSDMNKIVDFIDKLSEIDTEEVEELEYINDSGNVLRADDVKTHVTKEDALKNGPVTDSDFFKVPKVLKN